MCVTSQFRCLSSLVHVWMKAENICSLLHSRYIERLPLMFIFGIATSPSAIQHMLPHSVSSLLCIELFQSLTCTQHLATVIDKVILQSQSSAALGLLTDTGTRREFLM